MGNRVQGRDPGDQKLADVRVRGRGSFVQDGDKGMEIQTGRGLGDDILAGWWAETRGMSE